MAEDSTIILNSDDQSLGKIQIAPGLSKSLPGLRPMRLMGFLRCTVP